MSTESRLTGFALLLTALLLPLMLWLPTLAPGDPSVLSAAGLEGYNTVLAYRVALLWCMASAGAAYVVARRGWLPDPEASSPVATVSPSVGQRVLECAFLAAVVTAILWPPLLSRYGPFVEDAIFATALHRMHGGMVPYRDFEFLYGPLMLVPASWFMQVVGYSLRHYYVYLLLVELLQYVLLMLLLQRLIPQRGARWLALALLVSLLANPLLGLNYNGLRRLLPLGALLFLTRDPTSTRHAALAGVLIGAGVAYAHDYSIGAAMASVGLYVLLFVRTRDWSLARPAIALGVVALITWLTLAFVLLGDAVPAYLQDTRSLVARFSAGEAGFRFYWTANALAAFALLALCLTNTGRALAQRVTAQRATAQRATAMTATWTWGDQFFLCAVLATLLSLKSGLNRSDVWHLSGAFFPICAAVLLPIPRVAFGWSRTAQRTALLLVGVVGATHLLGNAPTAAYVAEGWLKAVADVRAHRSPPPACAPTAEAPCIEQERSVPRMDVSAVGAYLAAPPRRGRRVLLYGELWSFGQRLGVYKRDHLNDDFIYDDARGVQVGAWLTSERDAIVVIARPWYERLYAPAGADTIGATAPFTPSLVKRAGEYLSSVHYRGVVTERPLSELRWRRTVGAAVREHFERDTTFGELVVLRRRSSP